MSANRVDRRVNEMKAMELTICFFQIFVCLNPTIYVLAIANVQDRRGTRNNLRLTAWSVVQQQQRRQKGTKLGETSFHFNAIVVSDCHVLCHCHGYDAIAVAYYYHGC